MNPLDIRFLQPDVVKDMLLSKPEQIIVLDVRDDDFKGGHIKDCTHIPCHEIESEFQCDAFLNSIPSHIELVIVHCFLSQQRGPTVARRLTNRLSQLERLGQPEICVLANGWRRFHSLFGHNTDLCVYDD